jgi:hypothetical protein
MRMRKINVVRTAGQWIQRVLDVRLPMDVIAGLRTR